MGVPVVLVEREARLGGIITTEQVEGCVIEGGPDSFLASKPWALDLIRELGLESEVINSNDHLRVTYIWKDDRLIPLPDGLMMMVPSRIGPIARSSLLSWGTKIRMGLEYFRRPFRAAGADRSVAAFIEDHFGREAVEYLAEPLLAGVFGGDPDELSAVSTLPRFVELEKKYGSLTRGVLSEPAPGSPGGSLFRSLKGGLGQLIGALTPPAGTVIRGAVEDVEAGRVRVSGEWIESRHLVLACPAYEASPLMARLDGEISGLLGAVGYSSSITVALGFRHGEISHPLNGFGFLVPRRERRTLVACTWVGTKFPHRVPDTHALVRCFLGGTEYDEGAVLDDVRRTMGITAKPVFSRVFRWPRSMPQYTVGHSERQGRLENAMTRHPWLSLVGNAYRGIGIPDCVRMAKQAAEAIACGK
jgi:oxygen-dependent protoporphyrinogen oxidase